ncbi:MAG: type II secretion system protein [Rhodocyclaceae bacterium]|nr:type II secretion system protein [Rhodocyclaceae bacterium]MDZ4213951.1 type II secretion system protein [Rhodocyclaceae bacterium]
MGAGSRQRGVAFLGLLVVVAVMGVTLGGTATLWQQAQQREKERELLFIGLQYRRAIQRYYEQSPGIKTYPATLAVLLRDERLPGVRRHLRRPYRDPLTNDDAWGLVPAPAGGIMGVHSLAPGQPIRRANFPAELGWAGGGASYADWSFVYVPSAGAGGGAGGVSGH